jgi:hypothetical protein
VGESGLVWPAFWRTRASVFDVDCTVRVSNRFEDLSAHVELEENMVLEPGDEVIVHGPAIHPPYGEVRVERRRATIRRASWLGVAWARLTGDLDCLSLIDVGFDARRLQ